MENALLPLPAAKVQWPPSVNEEELLCIRQGSQVDTSVGGVSTKGDIFHSAPKPWFSTWDPCLIHSSVRIATVHKSKPMENALLPLPAAKVQWPPSVNEEVIYSIRLQNRGFQLGTPV
jgi:hypothetical protein